MKKAMYAGMCVFFLVFMFAPLWMPLFAGQGALTMATTTSTDDTGLLDYLLPHFTRTTGIDIKWIATGTGKALKLGENCDVDVLLVHAPEAEMKFVSDGYGIFRRHIMYNDFVIIGPSSDPAGIAGNPVEEAMKTLYRQKALFISRGDNSGTHKKELKLWRLAGATIPERTEWRLETGQGMLSTIRIADEQNGYTLSDRGTYIKYRNQKSADQTLQILVEKDPLLNNQYSIIPVHPDHCPNVKADEARSLADWLAGDTAQQLIGDFKISGKQLYIPNARTNGTCK
ncbi:MAG: substrate-binding domain-containing protein [Desulfobacterales bacterium]